MFNERATYQTYYSENPDDVDITPVELDAWNEVLESFEEPIRGELDAYGIPDTILHRSNVLVLAFLFRQGSVVDRVQRATYFYDATGLKDLG
jgi:hypothetical protein